MKETQKTAARLIIIVEKRKRNKKANKFKKSIQTVHALLY